jgi:hypothetical protein
MIDKVALHGIFLQADWMLSSFLDFIGCIEIRDYSLSRVSIKSGKDHKFGTLIS